MGSKLFLDKRGVSIPIAIFVVLMVILITTSLFYFSTREKNLNEVLDDVLVLDNFKLKVAFLDYYLENVFEKSVERAGGGYESFINAYFDELENYKVDGVYLVAELEQVENQISNLEIVEGKFVLELELEMVQDGEMNIRYNYVRVFESR